MQRLFFHNIHDKYSTELKNQLDSNIFIFDVYGKHRDSEILKMFNISTLPYLIDKQIIYASSTPTYEVGTFILEFSCCDYQENILVDEDGVFSLNIDGKFYDVVPENGIIQVEIECLITKDINIKIYRNNYYPFEINIEVVDTT
jgi:hypothetical protein